MLVPTKSLIMVLLFIKSVSCYVLSQPQEFHMMLSLALPQVDSHLLTLPILIDHLPYAGLFHRLSFTLRRPDRIRVCLHLDTSLMVPVVLHHGNVPIQEVLELPDALGICVSVQRELVDNDLQLLQELLLRV